jgi:hypothetical protein
MHAACEAQGRAERDFVVVPMMDQLVYYDHVFATGYPASDTTYLFERYVGDRLYARLSERRFSLVVLLDEMEDPSDLPLVIRLGDGEVLLMVMFDETVVTRAEPTNG